MHRVDDGGMKFLVSRQRNVRGILALCVSPNKRVIAVCEKGRTPEEDPGSAQVRHANTVTLNFCSSTSGLLEYLSPICTDRQMTTTVYQQRKRTLLVVFLQDLIGFLTTGAEGTKTIATW